MSENKYGKKFGILAGVGMIAYFLLFYAIDKDTMMSIAVSWTSLIILLVALFYAIHQHRKGNGGVLEFKDALRTGFLVAVLGNVIFYLFFFLLIKLDPELVTILKQKSIAFYRTYIGEEQLEAFEQSYENFTFGISDTLKALVRSIIGGFFLALLGAFIFKRKGSL